MPRGVPNSGYRRTSSLDAPASGSEEAVSAGSVDDAEPAEIDPPTEVEATTVLAPAVVELSPAVVEPSPAVVEPTAEQVEIKRLRDQLARERGKKDVEPEFDDSIVPGETGNIVIHFLEDGATALGKVWYRGDMLEFAPDSAAYKDTVDRVGRSWLDMRFDEFAQVDRWGKIMFRNGPWPGKTYADGSFESMRSERDKNVSVTAPTVEELEAADKARLRRAAPRLPAAV